MSQPFCWYAWITGKCCRFKQLLHLSSQLFFPPVSQWCLCEQTMPPLQPLMSMWADNAAITATDVYVSRQYGTTITDGSMMAIYSVLASLIANTYRVITLHTLLLSSSPNSHLSSPNSPHSPHLSSLHFPQVPSLISYLKTLPICHLRFPNSPHHPYFEFHLSSSSPDSPQSPSPISPLPLISHLTSLLNSHPSSPISPLSSPFSHLSTLLISHLSSTLISHLPSLISHLSSPLISHLSFTSHFTTHIPNLPSHSFHHISQTGPAIHAFTTWTSPCIRSWRWYRMWRNGGSDVTAIWWDTWRKWSHGRRRIMTSCTRPSDKNGSV